MYKKQSLPPPRLFESFLVVGGAHPSSSNPSFFNAAVVVVVVVVSTRFAALLALFFPLPSLHSTAPRSLCSDNAADMPLLKPLLITTTNASWPPPKMSCHRSVILTSTHAISCRVMQQLQVTSIAQLMQSHQPQLSLHPSKLFSSHNNHLHQTATQKTKQTAPSGDATVVRAPLPVRRRNNFLSPLPRSLLLLQCNNNNNNKRQQMREEKAARLRLKSPNRCCRVDKPSTIQSQPPQCFENGAASPQWQQNGRRLRSQLRALLASVDCQGAAPTAKKSTPSATAASTPPKHLPR